MNTFDTYQCQCQLYILSQNSHLHVNSIRQISHLKCSFFSLFSYFQRKKRIAKQAKGEPIERKIEIFVFVSAREEQHSVKLIELKLTLAMFDRLLCAFGTLRHTAATEHFLLTNQLFVLPSNYEPNRKKRTKHDQ